MYKQQLHYYSPKPFINSTIIQSMAKQALNGVRF